MKITDKAQHDEIMMKVSELCDGLTVCKDQFQRVLDVHVCRGVYDSTDAFWFVTEYTLKEEFHDCALFNFSYVDAVKSEMYDETSVTVYDDENEMQQHLCAFIADNRL